MNTFVFQCFGHPNILAKHKTTLEFTTDEYITHRGDCIIGVRSSKDLREIDKIMKEQIKMDSSKIIIQIKVNDLEEFVEGEGSSELDLSDSSAIIIRKSSFKCPRTLMINSNKAAKDISREIIELMKDENSVMDVIVQVRDGSIDTSKHA